MSWINKTASLWSLVLAIKDERLDYAPSDILVSALAELTGTVNRVLSKMSKDAISSCPSSLSGESSHKLKQTTQLKVCEVTCMILVQGGCISV